MDIKYNTDTKIEDNARLYQLQKANFDQEVNTAVSVYNIFSRIQIRSIGDIKRFSYCALSPFKNLLYPQKGYQTISPFYYASP